MKKLFLIFLISIIPISLVGVAVHLTMEQYFETKTLRIATGGKGGTYHTIGDGYGRLFAEDPRIQIHLAEHEPYTEGAFENLELLEKGEADIGFVQGGLPKRPGIFFVMNLYRASVQIIARRGLVNRSRRLITELEDIDDYDGPDQICQRISIGSPKSGTRILALKLLKFYQKDSILEPSSAPTKVKYQPNIRTLGFQDSLLALKLPPSDPKAIDIAFFVSGTGTVDAIKKLLYRTDAEGTLVDDRGRPLALDPTIFRIEEQEGIVPELAFAPAGDEDFGQLRPKYRFLSIDRAKGLTTQYPYLESVDIPKGTYSSRLSFPDQDVPTVSVYEMLCASEKADLDWMHVNRLTEAIWKKKSLLEQVPQLALNTEEEARRSIEYEAHPGAVDFFNNRERLPWALILAGTSAFISVFGSLTKVRMWVFRWRMLREMAWIYALEDKIPTASRADLERWLAEVEKAHEQLTMDFIKIRVGIGQGISIVLERVRLIRDRIRTRLKELQQQGVGAP